MTAIVELIKDYMRAAERALSLFENTFGRRDLIKAWREGAVPQTGELAGGIEYQIHGIGCWVDLPEGEVDFDFAYSNDVGFDAWRLWLYAKQFPDRYGGYEEKAQVERDVDAAVALGLAEPFEKYPRLLRLTDEVKAR